MLKKHSKNILVNGLSDSYGAQLKNVHPKKEIVGSEWEDCKNQRYFKSE